MALDPAATSAVWGGGGGEDARPCAGAALRSKAGNQRGASQRGDWRSWRGPASDAGHRASAPFWRGCLLPGGLGADGPHRHAPARTHSARLGRRGADKAQRATPALGAGTGKAPADATRPWARPPGGARRGLSAALGAAHRRRSARLPWRARRGHQRARRGPTRGRRLRAGGSAPGSWRRSGGPHADARAEACAEAPAAAASEPWHSLAAARKVPGGGDYVDG
jgi:hypothetical protein